MRAVVKLLVLLLALLAAPVWAQSREANLERLKADPSPEGIERTLADMPHHEAMQAAGDFADHLQAQGGLSALQHATLRQNIVKHYLPGNDENAAAAREYWAYRVMIAAKLDRKEIAKEEYDYLLEKKLNEARQGIARRDAQQQAQHAQRQHAEYAAQQAAEAQQNMFLGNMLQGMGRTLRAQTPPAPVYCSSTRVGSSTSTICR